MKPLVALALLPGCLWARGGESASCPKDGPIDLGLQEDVKKVAGCEQLPGITIRTGAPIDVTPLAQLEVINGDLTIGPTVDVTEIAFNGLLRVAGTIRVSNNGSLRGLFLPRLEQAGRIQIENNVVLTSISMPRLATVDSAVVIADNGSLEMLSAPLLASVGKELVIAGHGKLNLVEVSHLTTVEAVRIEGNPAVPAEVVEQLRSKATLNRPEPPPTN
jgi:hypothetical protein